MKRKRPIRVGVDFDGVLAYNPARIARRLIKIGKRVLLGKRAVSFVVPKNKIAAGMWILAHKTSIFPANGTERLKKMSGNKNAEFHLITGRYPMLEKDLYDWIRRHGLENAFKTINPNREWKQPHIFKLETIRRLGLDYYIEDNLDIVEHLETRVATKILWIYNLLDRGNKRGDKFNCLDEALKFIKER